MATIEIHQDKTTFDRAICDCVLCCVGHSNWKFCAAGVAENGVYWPSNHGYANENHFLIPGPSCPGPGVYELVKKESHHA
jgi:hypothetical protein